MCHTSGENWTCFQRNSSVDVARSRAPAHSLHCDGAGASVTVVRSVRWAHRPWIDGKGARIVALTLTSSAFQPDGAIPPQYTCDGEDDSPPLAWSGVPAKARSLVLIVDDPDAPDPKAPRPWSTGARNWTDAPGRRAR